jgi:hypothetical protein
MPIPERDHDLRDKEKIMADLTSTTVAANFNKHVISQSDAGHELIVKVALSNMTDANLKAIYNAITLPGGSGGSLPADTGDAFTVAGFGTANGAAFVSGETDVVYFRVQGSGGTFSTVDAAAGTGATVTVEAVFKPAL